MPYSTAIVSSVPAAYPVGQRAAEEPADDRADQHGRHGQFLGPAAQLECALQQVLGPADDADVVAEQHPADRRDRADQIRVTRGLAHGCPGEADVRFT
jgi:hypothetical protein